MTQPTQAEIDRLVKAASALVPRLQKSGFNTTYLEQALRPFQSDPEAELVEKMADAIVGEYGIGYTFSNLQPHTRVEAMNMARSALAVVKERGLP